LKEEVVNTASRPLSVYLDYNATTPLDGAVREAMLPFLDEDFGNPSSIHHLGRRVRTAIDEARERVAATWRCKPSEVVFTSGGTESNNLALFGTARLLRAKGRHVITSAIEHHSVLHPCRYLAEQEGFSVTYLPVDSEGVVAIDEVRNAFRKDTVLVSIMAANNETGVIQPVSEIGALCRERGILFHTDAVQWFAKETFTCIDQFNADLVSFCAHKLHGPKGAGALFVRSPLRPHPIMLGGSHEDERRAGTENPANIIGLAEVVSRFVFDPVFNRRQLFPFTQRLLALARSVAGVIVPGGKAPRLSNTVSISVAGCDSISLLAGLDLESICASSGSACSAGSLEPSHVLRAMGFPDSMARSFVRFSFGRESQESDISAVELVLPGIIQRIRAG